MEERIVTFLRDGGLAHDAATSCGISEVTYYRHRRRNRAFAQAADKAQAEARLEAAAHVAKSNPAFYLSRTDREHWGPHLSVTTQNAAPRDVLYRHSLRRAKPRAPLARPGARGGGHRHRGRGRVPA